MTYHSCEQNYRFYDVGVQASIIALLLTYLMTGAVS
jgi:hypothetical protein